MLEVVAIALIDANERILVQRRRPERQHGGLWEFPGGKLNPHETAVAGLLREVWEELGLRLVEADLQWLAQADDRAAQIVIRLYTCRSWTGEPQCLDAEELGWITADELTALPMPPLDVSLAEALRTALKCAI